MNKKTLVLGASPNPDRVAYQATKKLTTYGHTTIPVGIKAGTIQGLDILTTPPQLKDIDTVTLYLSPERQKPYYNYILSLKPKRIIFNPGTENEELWDLARQHNIECLEACTLVMLSIGNY